MNDYDKLNDAWIDENDNDFDPHDLYVDEYQDEYYNYLSLLSNCS